MWCILLFIVFVGCSDDEGYVPGSIIAAADEQREQENARQEKLQKGRDFLNTGFNQLSEVLGNISDMISLWNSSNNLERTKERASLALSNLERANSSLREASLSLDRTNNCENNLLKSLQRISGHYSNTLGKFLEYLDDSRGDSSKLDDANQNLHKANKEIETYNALPKCN